MLHFGLASFCALDWMIADQWELRECERLRRGGMKRMSSATACTDRGTK